MALALLFLLLTLRKASANVQCGEVRNQTAYPHIVGGTPAAEGQFPWMAMLLYNDRFVCGGTIIDPQHVVTAAHCLREIGVDRHNSNHVLYVDTSALQIIAGRHTYYYSGAWTYTGEQRVSVAAGTYHEFFDTGRGADSHDIALLRLSRPLTFNSRVASLCLPRATTPVPARCTLAGWGDVDGFEREPRQLLKVTMAAFNRSACVNLEASMSQYDIRQYRVDLANDLALNTMCLANVMSGGQESCFGDSGGPVFCLDSSGQRYELMGVVSWGYGKCPGLRAFPSVLTFVPAYLSWIQQAITDLASPCATLPCPVWSTCQVQATTSYQCVSRSSNQCGQRLTAAQGFFTSPNFPLQYDNNLDCLWVVVAGRGSTVELTFLAFDMEGSGCSFDYVEVRESSTSGRLLAKLCGTRRPSGIVSNTSLNIHFHTDYSVTGTGFKASYQILSPDCPNFMFGANCSRPCNCVVNNSMGCAKEQGFCRCQTGWSGATCSVDVNECLNANPCEGSQKVCKNYAGGYNCSCVAPLAEDTSGNCVFTSATDGQCGVRRNQTAYPHIVGGAPAVEGQYPWMAMLLYRDHFICGGTIIDPQHIVTAAHCLQELTAIGVDRQDSTGSRYVAYVNTSILQIVAGRQTYYHAGDQIYPGEQKISVAAGTYHEGFKTGLSAFSHDIALLRLSRPLTFNSRVGSLCLPSVSTPVPARSTLAGWGDIDGYEDKPRQLLQVTMAAYSRSACVNLQSSMSQSDVLQYKVNLDTDLAPDIMCLSDVAYGRHQACFGDSGGPVFWLDSSGQHYELLGVTSWIYGKCPGLRAFPSVFTFVPAYLPWIQQAVSDLVAPCATFPCPATSTCQELATSYQCVNGNSNQCGQRMQGRRGIFTSPNFPSQYSNNINCQWTIVPASGQTVELAFLSFHLEGDAHNCYYDYVDVRQNSASGKLLYRLCGTKTLRVIVSNTPLYINFHTDGSEVGMGFKASYRILDPGVGLSAVPETKSIPVTFKMVNAVFDMSERNAQPANYAILQQDVKTFLIDKTRGILDVNITNVMVDQVAAVVFVSASTAAVSTLVNKLKSFSGSCHLGHYRLEFCQVELSGTPVSNNYHSCDLINSLRICTAPATFCDDSTDQAVCRKEDKQNASKFEPWKGIVIGVFCAVIIVAAFIIGCCIHRNKKSAQKTQNGSSPAANLNMISSGRLQSQSGATLNQSHRHASNFFSSPQAIQAPGQQTKVNGYYIISNASVARQSNNTALPRS